MTIMRGNRIIGNIYYGAPGAMDPSVLNGKVDKFTDLQLKNGEDLNNYKARRRIKLSSSSLLNCPNGWGMMEVLPDEVDNSHAGRQIIYTNIGDIYNRCWEGENWTSWRKITYDGNNNTITNWRGTQAEYDALTTEQKNAIKLAIIV